MWTCTQCSREIEVKDAPPEIDDKGIFFICPTCRHRNVLKRVGPSSDDDPLDLVQLDS